jgi:hypothetical protein
MDQRRVDSLVDLLLGRTTPSAVDVPLIVSADTLLGRSGAPAWIAGVGPVTPTEAQELVRTRPTPTPSLESGPADATGGTMSADGPTNGSANRSTARTQAGTADEIVDSLPLGPHVTIRRLLTDPSSGVLTDVAERRYRPSAALDRAVRARDVTCRFPGCRRAASSPGTDLDHTVPWPSGTTSADNLAVLCRRHHRLKHVAGWKVSLGPDGTMVWTTPTGRPFRTLPWQYTDPPTP